MDISWHKRLEKWAAIDYFSSKENAVAAEKQPFNEVLKRRQEDKQQQLKTCPVCGVEFSPREGEYPSFFKERKTCSRECGNKINGRHYKETSAKICVVCGDEFIRKDKERPGKFLIRQTCSRACASKLLWQNPSCKEKMLGSMRRNRQKSNYKKKISEATRKAWEDNSLRKEAVSERSKKNWQSQEFREKIAATNIERYGVPYITQTEQYKISLGGTSNVNKQFVSRLEELSIEYEPEFTLDKYIYDVRVRDTLIEINPFPYHNVTWHPFNNPLETDYHLNKTSVACSYGYRCIHVWDWDDQEKIINLFIPKETLYARNLYLKEVPEDESKEFLEKYHFQRGTKSQPIRLGLYLKDELVSIMVFGKPRYNKNYDFELLRLCTKPNFIVVGGSSKLFKHFTNVHKGGIISYCDLSKFSGEVYTKLGMEILREGKPSRHWYNPKTRQHFTDSHVRQHGFDRLVGRDLGASFGKGTSNDELLRECGFVEIYDCGQLTYAETLMV